MLLKEIAKRVIAHLECAPRQIIGCRCGHARHSLLRRFQAIDRTLLKLDLWGHELQALAGAAGLLASIEVALVEVPFFGDVDLPTARDMIAFFGRSGFDLFEIASLGGRPRAKRLRQADFFFVRRGSPLSADAARS